MFDKQIRKRALNREVLSGSWLVLGSALTAEIAGRAGFDWLVIDLEHGMGGLESALSQLLALEATPAAPVIRVRWNDPHLIKQVLELGPLGIMIPFIQDAEEAARAVSAMRYPPQGIRGISPLSRGADFGINFKEYFHRANAELLTIVQIENAQAVENAAAIAAIDGVDVLFIGPMDLSTNLGLQGEFEHPMFKAACEQVVTACRNAGKAAGLLLLGPEQLPQATAAGFTFLALGSDGGQLAAGMRGLTAAFGA